VMQREAAWISAASSSAVAPDTHQLSDGLPQALVGGARSWGFATGVSRAGVLPATWVALVRRPAGNSRIDPLRLDLTTAAKRYIQQLPPSDVI
jgi:hypothetical protein